MDIKTLYIEKCKIIKKIKSLGDALYDLPFEDFIYHIAFLTPQSYGNKIEKYTAKLMDAELVSSKLDKGDIKTKDGKYLEIKSSIITETNDSLNIVQIRPWQDIDGYVINIIELVNNVFVYHCLQLTKQQMQDECTYLNVTAAHGTKQAVNENKNVELRLSLKKDSDVYNRWIKEYNTSV